MCGNKTAIRIKSKIFTLSHTFVIPDEIKIASGDTDFIIPQTIKLAPEQTAKIVKCVHSINSGTSATVKLQKNGGDITGYTGISVTPTPATTTQDAALADGDEIAVVITAINTTPKNISVNIIIEYTV